MVKLLIPLGIIVGLISAIILVQKVRNIGKSPSSSRVESRPVDAGHQPSRADTPRKNQETPSGVGFEFQPSDPWISTPDSPYSTPERDYSPGRASSDGYTQAAHDGVALVISSPEEKKYIVTPTGRPEHRYVRLFGYSSPPLRIQADCPESDLLGPQGRGLWINKDVGYGVVEDLSKVKATIRRIDGGVTILSFTKGSLRDTREETHPEKPMEPVAQPPSPPVSPTLFPLRKEPLR